MKQGGGEGLVSVFMKRGTLDGIITIILSRHYGAMLL